MAALTVASLPVHAAPQNAPLDPRDAAYLLDLADVHLKYDKTVDAMALYTRVASLARETPIRGRAVFGTGLVHLAMKEWQPAVGCLRLALEQVDANQRGPVSLVLARAYAKSGQQEQAETQYAGILQARERDAVTATAAARDLLLLYASSPNAAQAAARWEKERTDDPVMLALAAEIYRQVLMDKGKAIPCYERLRKLEPGRADHIQNLVDLYRESDRIDDCVKLCRELAGATQDVGAAAQWRLYEAEFMVQKKEGAGARELLQNVLKGSLSSPQRSSIQLALWRVMKETGDLAQEIAALTQKVATVPQARRSLMAIYELVLPDPKKFLETAEPLLKDGSAEPDLWMKCAERYSGLGLQEEAERTWLKIIDGSRELSGRALHPYIVELLAQKKGSQAASFLKELEQKRPELAPACLQMRYLVQVQLGNKAEALALADDLEKASLGEDPLPALGNVAVLKNGGHLDRALRVVQALEQKSMEAQVLARVKFEKIDLYERAGLLPQAEEVCRDLLERTLDDESRRTVERKLLDLIQRQGKPTRINK